MDKFYQMEEIKRRAIFEGQLKSCIPFFNDEVEGSNRRNDKCEKCFIKNKVIEMKIKNPMFQNMARIQPNCTDINYKLVEKNMQC